MRTIYVTGGGKDYAQLTVTDKLGHDLSTATIQMGVSTDQTTPPTSWTAPSLAAYPQAGTAVLSLLCDSTKTPPGTYWLWADVTDNPTVQPVCSDLPFVTR